MQYPYIKKKKLSFDFNMKRFGKRLRYGTFKDKLLIIFMLILQKYTVICFILTLR